jgi:hypothetical protein
MTTSIPSTSPNIFFNLTSHNLDEFKPILNLGIKHIDTPKDTSTDEIIQEVRSFVNKIAWKDYFQQRNFPVENDFDPYFKLPNKAFKYQMPQHILDLEKQLITTAQSYEKRYPPKPRYRKILKLKKYLNDHPDIRLILSDKNLGIVAIKTTTYNELVLQHLQSDKYELVGPQTIPFFQPFFAKLRQDFSNVMRLIQNTETTPDLINYAKYYSNYHQWSIPNFHVLLKLHKGLNPLKSRPIVAAVNWLTTPVSRVLAKKIFSLFKDERQIAHKTLDIVTAVSQFNILIKHYNQDELFLVTLDIKDLYTNIDLPTLERLLNSVDPYYAYLMNFVCNNNYMNYRNSIYKQTNGIAMGTNCAPELANFYLSKLLDPILLQNRNVKLFQRFLDDILIVWHGKKSDFLPLLLQLKAATGLGFTLKASKRHVDFLDLKLLFSNGYIEHCTHQKLLNKYGYITPKSCHPRHTFSGFIKAELTRYAINSSKLQYYLITKKLFYDRLLLRGYQRSYLKPLFQNHMYTARYASKPQKSKSSATTLAIRYSFRRNIKGISKLFKVNTNHLCSSFLPNHSTRMSWKRSPNLFDLLCSSRLSADQAAYLETNGA